MSAHLAPALATLRAQIRAAFPACPPIGWIGDADHRARKSQHNPDPDGTVDAIDVPHAPGIGLDCHRLTAELIASGDPRLQLLIWDRRIWSRARAGEGWRAYHGASPHTAHAHVETTDAGQHDGRGWNLPMLVGTPPPIPTPPPTPTEDDDMASWLISDGAQVWLTDGLTRRAVTAPTDDLGVIAQKLREVMFVGWARNAVKSDGVPEVATNPQILASIPVA